MTCFKLFIAIFFAAWIIPLGRQRSESCVQRGFDEPNVCTEYEAKCAPAAWFYVYATGPGWGYKPKINSSPYSIQLFSAWKKDNTRSFWQTMLAQPVVPGQDYLIEVDVSAEKGKPNMNDIGIVVTRKMNFAIYSEYKLPEKYISFSDAQVTKLDNGWYHLSKTCSFTDTMQVLVIGNFSNKSNAQILKERNNKDGYIVTNIDNLSMVPVNYPDLTTTVVAVPVISGLKDSLYKITDRHRGLYELANRKTIIPIENGISQKKINTLADTLIIPDVAFAFDSYELIDRPLLVRQLQPVLRGRIAKVVVEGFTDAKGSVTYNDTFINPTCWRSCRPVNYRISTREVFN